MQLQNVAGVNRYGERMRDSEVVASIVAGNPEGLAVAYDRYSGPLFGYCQSLLRKPEDAADAVQDTFVIAASKLGRRPLRQLPYKVNCDTINIAPPASIRLRFILPFSSGKMRSCVAFSRRKSASARPSSFLIPINTSNPVRIRATVSFPIDTLASLTR